MISIRMDIDQRATLKINARLTALEESLNKQYRRKVLAMFAALVKISPQFSGDFASNWQIVAGPGQEKAYRRWRHKADSWRGPTARPAVSRGDAEAVEYARARARKVEFTYKDKVFFTNATPLDFTRTTVRGEGVTRNLRAENILADWERIASYLKANHGE